MTKSFKEALKARRTFYRIQNKSTLSDKEIRDLICFAVEFVPSAGTRLRKTFFTMFHNFSCALPVNNTTRVV